MDEPSTSPDSAPIDSGIPIATVVSDPPPEPAVNLADLFREIRERFALDRFREEQIDQLHEELQAYKSDLVGKTARQLLQGLIRLHDDLGRMATTLRQKPPEELTAERFFQHFADFQDDIELLLGQHGVERFQASGDAFDPRRQTVLRTIPADDPARVGQIAERLRPGFEQGEALLQKERVAVYVASKDNNDKAQGGQS